MGTQLQELYASAVSNIAESTKSGRPEEVSLRSTCKAGIDFNQLSVELGLSISKAIGLNITDAKSSQSLLKIHNNSVKDILLVLEDRNLCVFTLERTIQDGLALLTRNLEKLNKKIEIAEAEDRARRQREESDKLNKEREIENNKRRSQEKREKEQRKADLEAAKARERAESAAIERQKAAESEKKAIQDEIDRANRWRAGITNANKKRFLNLSIALISTAAFITVFASWKSGPSGIVLMIVLAFLIGPSKIKSLVKQRLAEKNGGFLDYGSELAFQTGGIIGGLQLIVGLILSPVLWMFGISSALWSLVLPIGWNGISGFLIVLPCCLLTVWLWGGFYAGIAAKRLLARHSINDFLTPGEGRVNCPHCNNFLIIRVKENQSENTCPHCSCGFLVD